MASRLIKLGILATPTDKTLMVLIRERAKCRNRLLIIRTESWKAFSESNSNTYDGAYSLAHGKVFTPHEELVKC